MENGFRLKATLPAAPKDIYDAWLSSAEHTAMTGGAATASAQVGARFTAWDGYIEGRNLELKPHWCIVQSWRTTQFAPGEPDSRLEICIHPKGSESEVLLIHTNIPPDQVESYRSGWVDHYFAPMRVYFAARQRPVAAPARKPAKKTAAKSHRKASTKKSKAKKRPARKSAKKKSARKKSAKKKSARRRSRR